LPANAPSPSPQTNPLPALAKKPNRNLAASFAKSPHRPRVLLALPFMTMGGGEALMLHVAQHLKENGFDLCALTTIPTDKSLGSTVSRFEAITKEIYHLHQFLLDEEKWKDFICYLIESKQVDILLIAGCSFVYPLLPELKSRFPHLKVVDQLLNEVGHIESNRKYGALIDMNVVTSDLIQDVLVNRFGESEEKVRVIANGIDVEHEFNPARETGGEEVIAPVMREKFLVTFAGRFSEEKCPEKFVEIAAALKNDLNMFFLMLGDGPEFSRVQNKIRELGLSGLIHTPGFVDAAPFLKRSSVVVICSRVEGTPLVLMESMSLGVPVVASNVGGIPSFIHDGHNGLLCEPNDISAFVRAIRRIAADRELRESLRTNAREYALRCLNVVEMKQKYLETFTRLLAATQELESPLRVSDKKLLTHAQAQGTSPGRTTR